MNNKTYSEIRVYGIDVQNYEVNDLVCDWDDEKFMAKAEEQGNVWSLTGFEDAFNEGIINQSNLIIRIYKIFYYSIRYEV